MSPMAKMPFSLVSNCAVSTGIRFSLRLMPQLATGPSFIVSPKKHSITSVFCSKVVPSGPFTVTELEGHVAALNEVEHLLHRRRCRTELLAAVKQRERLGDRLEVERPIERRVAAADDQHVSAPEILQLAHRVEDGLVLILLDAGQRRPLRREGSATGGDHHDLAFECLAEIGG